MLSEDLQIYKDLFLLCKTLLRYQQQISKTVRYGEYAVAVQERHCEHEQGWNN